MVSLRAVLMTTTALGAISVSLVFTDVAIAADLGKAATPVVAPVGASSAAVDGINGAFSLYGGGGDAAGGVFGGTGTLALPIGLAYGTQIDATVSSVRGKFAGSIADHLFWRDPSKGLIGLYGSYAHYSRYGGTDVGRAAAEGEWYLGRFTLRGIAGVEFGSKGKETIGLNTYGFDVKTRAFDMVDLVFYPTDNLSLFAGHRYTFGKHAAALGGEYLVSSIGSGTAVGIFAEGRIGEGDDKAVYAGVKIHFGNSNKTLIRRDREDDPNNWEPSSLLGLSGASHLLSTYQGEG